MHRSWKFSVLFTGLILSAAVSPAQTSAVKPRITARIDESSLSTLSGTVPILAKPRYDRGAAHPEIQLSHIRLVLSRSARQETALTQYEAELQDTASPNYHQWLTPQEFGRLFGPADSDIAAIRDWLESRGFVVESVSPGHTNIAFSGTVSQVEEAFHTEIHSFNANGETFLSNVSDPRIPSALAPVVTGVAHLNTIPPHPQYVRGGAGRMNPGTGRMEPLEERPGNGLAPNFTGGSGTSSSPYRLFIVPGDAATIYDTPTAYNANYTSGTSYTGTGVTIGIGGDAVIQGNTVANYRRAFLGDLTPPIITNVDGVTSTDATDEGYLDTEIAGGLAPRAAIHFYTSTDLYSAIEKAINDNAVDIFSLSFGIGEWARTTADNALTNSWWQQAAAQGIAVTVSSGDTGSALEARHDSQGNLITQAVHGLQVSGFASTPYNIAVGGTDFYPLPNSYATYASTSQGSSSTFYRTANSYIPEAAWNNSTANNATLSANVPWTATSYPTRASIVAGSGGKSSCSTNTDTNTAIGACTSGYAKPSWQRGPGVPADGARDLPDVSLMAGSGRDNAAWLVCTDDQSTNASGVLITSNCANQSDGYFYFRGIGGTSASAPAFAGILALVQQKAGGRLGQAAQQLYDLLNGSHASAIFHDVTVGNISVPCDPASSNQGGACVRNSAGYYFLSGYDANPGYDLATGLGSVDVNQLVTYWGTGTGPSAATVTVTPAASNIVSRQTLSVTATVTGTTGTPTGTVTLSGGGYTSAAGTLSGGSYTFTIPANSLSIGTDTLTVAYSGDPNFAPATGTAAVTVRQPTFTLSAANVTVKAGSSGTSAVAITPVDGYTGTVTLTAAGPSNAGILLNGGAVTINSPASTTGSVTVGTAAAQSAVRRASQSNGQGWRQAAGGAVFAAMLIFFLPIRRRPKGILCALMLMVSCGLTGMGCGGGAGGGGGPSKTTPTIAISPARNSVAVNSSLSVSISVTGSGSTPTGTLNLSSGSYSSPGAAISAGSATITIPANSLAVGTNTLTSTYSGDGNYNPAAGTTTVTGTSAVTSPGTYTITVTGTDSVNPNITASTTFALTVN